MLNLESLAHVDMSKLSQSELHSLSLCSAAAFDLHSHDNLVLPADLPSTTSITATTATGIAAYSHRRGARSRRLVFDDDGDPHLAENKSILNSLTKLVARKRKRKPKAVDENVEELEGLSVINVNGEEVDLKFLARVGDGAYEGELKRMTEGLLRKDELLGFLKGLEGRWCSSRKRRKVVDAGDFVKALPINWKIMLALRPRARRPSLYCRRYISPSGVQFKSCKEAAFYLKAQFVTNITNPPEEACMMEIERDRHVGPESADNVPSSSFPDQDVNMLGIDDLPQVQILSHIECYSCKMVFNDMHGLEHHLGKFHGRTTRRLDFNSLTRKGAIPHAVVHIPNPDNLPQIVENSLERQSDAVGKDTVIDCEVVEQGPMMKSEFKTRCMWCLNDFFRELVDAETLANSTGFICPKCKEEISGGLESSLSKFCHHC